MKKYLPILILFLFQLIEMKMANAQHENAAHLFRVYEDNDIMNINGHATDEAYSNGTRLDFYYEMKKPSAFFLPRIMPKAGNESINEYGWSLMQIIFTPRDITCSAHQPNDYQYAGALLASHSLISSDPVSKFNYQTEITAGVRGSASYAEQTQKFVHRLINSPEPMGWNHQLKNKFVVNLNVAAEKQLWHLRNCLEIIGGGGIHFGNLLTGAKIYSTIRIGKMNPYFNGFIARHASSKKDKNKMQAYFILKPTIGIVGTNAMVQSSIGENNLQQEPTSNGKQVSKRDCEHLASSIEYGMAMSQGKFSISFTEKYMSALAAGLYSHAVGNITATYSW